jgi:sortase A
MGEKLRSFADTHRVGLYLLLAGVACVVLLGAVLVGTSILRAGSEPVHAAFTPVASPAPEPIDRSVAEDLAAKEKVAREKAAEKKKAAREKAAKEKAEKKDEKKAEEKRETAERRAVDPQPAAQPAPVAPSDTTLYLTVPKMGRYNDPVINSVDPGVLNNGAGKLPLSGFPWEPGANTYIAAHVYGYQGTGSWQQFAGLPSMTYGDLIYLTDANGTTYTYAVSEILTVSPYDVWVSAPVPGRTIVTLQTCTGPGWAQRLIVRADLVS